MVVERQRLRRSNPNATGGVSTHEYGTTVDVVYSAFSAPTTPVVVRPRGTLWRSGEQRAGQHITVFRTINGQSGVTVSRRPISGLRQLLKKRQPTPARLPRLGTVVRPSVKGKGQ